MKLKKVISLVLGLMLLLSLSISSYANNESDINPICTLEEHGHSVIEIRNLEESSVEISPRATFCCIPDYRTDYVTMTRHKRISGSSEVTCRITTERWKVCIYCDEVWEKTIISTLDHFH